MAGFDTGVLLGAQGVRVPDPLQYAQQGLALSSLADNTALRRIMLQQQQTEQQARDALNSALPSVMGGGWSPESIQRAIASNPQAAGPLLDMLDKKRKSEADYANTQAQAAERTSVAQKNRLAPITNMAFELANKPDLNPNDIANLHKLIAANGLENIVPSIPMQAWTNPESARAGLKTIGSAFFDAEKQSSQAETKRAALVGEAQTATKNAAQIQRWKDETGIGYGNLDIARNRLNQESLGQPQEVTIDGRPALASFSRKGGGWYDPQTGAVITGQVAPKTPELSGSVREKFAANNQMLAKIDFALGQVNDRPQSFGLKFAGPDMLNVRTDPQGVPSRAAVASIGSQKFHDLSGAAITISEAPRLQPFIPSVNDPPAAIRAKLMGLKRETEILQQELVSGRPTSAAINSRPITPVMSGAETGGRIRSITPLD